MQKLSSAQIHCILNLLDSGLYIWQISHQTGHGIATISCTCSDNWPELQKSSGGCPTKLSTTNIKYAHWIICMGKIDDATEAAKTLLDITNSPFSSQTLCQHLKSCGMRPVVKRKCPLLKPHHRWAWLKLAEPHAEWILEDWKRFIWSDETKINCLGSDGRKYVWKDRDEGLSDRLVEGTVKFGGGNLLLWGCMAWDGVGYATRIEGKIDVDLYVSIMEDELQQTLELCGKLLMMWYFSRIMTPNTSKKAKKWFENNDITVLK